MTKNDESFAQCKICKQTFESNSLFNLQWHEDSCSAISGRKYNKEWEKKFPWLSETKNGLPECKVCKLEFSENHSGKFERHAKTKNHKKLQKNGARK